MMRKIIFSLYLIMGYSLTVNAEVINLESMMVLDGNLSDGDVIATGRVFCGEGNIARVSLLNMRVGEDTYGNIYSLQGRNRVENKIIVRIEGDGWHSSDRGLRGIYKTQKSKSEQFYVVVNGRQNVNSDIYTIKANSTCLHSYQE